MSRAAALATDELPADLRPARRPGDASSTWGLIGISVAVVVIVTIAAGLAAIWRRRAAPRPTVGAGAAGRPGAAWPGSTSGSA